MSQLLSVEKAKKYIAQNNVREFMGIYDCCKLHTPGFARKLFL